MFAYKFNKVVVSSVEVVFLRVSKQRLKTEIVSHIESVRLKIVIDDPVHRNSDVVNILAEAHQVSATSIRRVGIVHRVPVWKHVNRAVLPPIPSQNVGFQSDVFHVFVEIMLVLHSGEVALMHALRKSGCDFLLERVVALSARLEVGAPKLVAVHEGRVENLI